MPATFVLDMQQNPRSSRLETQHSNGWPQFIGIKRFDVKIVVVVLVLALIAREAVTVTVTVSVTVAVTVAGRVTAVSKEAAAPTTCDSHQVSRTK